MHALGKVNKLSGILLMVALVGCANTATAPRGETMNRVGDGRTKDTSNMVVKQWDKDAPLTAAPSEMPKTKATAESSQQ